MITFAGLYTFYYATLSKVVLSDDYLVAQMQLIAYYQDLNNRLAKLQEILKEEQK